MAQVIEQLLQADFKKIEQQLLSQASPFSGEDFYQKIADKHGLSRSTVKHEFYKYIYWSPAYRILEANK